MEKKQYSVSIQEYMYKSPHFAFKVSYPNLARELSTVVTIENLITHKSIEVKGIWDTGATNSVISKKVFALLNLFPIDTAVVSGVNSLNHTAIVTIAHLLLPNKVKIENVRFTVDELANTEVLIGMDIISKGDFSISNANNQTVFSFALPSFENPTDLLDKANKVNERNKKHFPPQFLKK